MTAARQRRAPGPADMLDRQLLNLLQSEFPIVAEPYAALAARLGTNQADVLERMRRLWDNGVIRHLNAIIDGAAVGYRTTLVALEVDPARIDDAAAVISAHPGVSHNYARDNALNLWFVVAVPPGADPAAAAADLAARAGAKRHLLLPALKLFKIAVEFDVVNGRPAARTRRRRSASLRRFDERERALIRVLQDDLPLAPRPFAAAAQAAGLSEEDLLAGARRLLEEGVIRRFAAVLRHHDAGFEGNGMVCWRVPEGRVDEVGEALAASPLVTHCYHRPTYPDWPYPVYAMIHARNRRECEAAAADLSRQVGVADYLLLFSVHEYKKERPRYFSEPALR